MNHKTGQLLYTFRFILPLSLVCTILHVLVVKNRDRVTFTWQDASRPFLYSIIFLALLICFFLYFCFFWALHLLRRKNQIFLSYFKYFCLYGGIMGVFFLLTWPGIFKGDEFYVIKSALSFTLSPAQSGLTSIFYIVALLIFPSMATITFLQLLLICSIFAYIMKNLKDIYPSRLRYLTLIIFFLPPVIDGNLFTLRATLVGWVFLLIICKLFFAYQRKRLPAADMLALSALSGLIIAWRSEFIYLLLLLPVSCLILKLVDKKRTLLMALLIVVCFGACNVPNKIALNGSNKYPISLVLNPLANLFTEVEKLKGPDVYDDVMTINELVDVQLLRQSASVRNISQYWNIDDVLPKEQLNRFMKASLRLIAYNPGLFLKYRTLTFLHTNGFYPDEINHPGGEDVDAINKLVYYGTDYKSLFVLMEPPFGQTLREKCISFLACRHYDKKNTTTTMLLPVFYNCIPTLILLFIALVLNAIKKKGYLAIMILLTLAQAVLIFLTAPAMFFMYYFGFYLCGGFLVLLSILVLFKRSTSDTD